jgi:leucyl aminopeptidase
MLNDITDAVYLARDLINEPSIISIPQLLYQNNKNGKKAGFRVEVLNKGRMNL